MQTVTASAHRAGVAAYLFAVGFALAAIVPFAAHAAAPASLQTSTTGKLVLVCRSGASITVDLDHATVTDSISDQPATAQITRDAIQWHHEFDSIQFDPHYGGQRVHNTAEYAINRQSRAMSNGDICDVSNP